MSKDIILLMTACINPINSYDTLVIKSIDERLQQYLEALHFYIEDTSIQNIVFCDNSNYMTTQKAKMQNIAKQKGKSFEWLTYEGTAKTALYGKGYGEGEIIEWALKHSKILKSNDYFLKVTGRLIVSNIDDIIKHMDIRKNYFIGDMYNSYKGIDTRFFGCTNMFYKEVLLDAYKTCNDKKGKIIEKEFYSILYHNYKIYGFKCYPSIIGCSAGSGADYSKLVGWKKRFVNFLCYCNLYNSCFWIFYIPKAIKKRML